MSPKSDLGSALDRDISMAHDRFLEVMEARLPTLSVDQKERYFAVLSLLIAKLEAPEKTLRDVLSEMMMEAASHLFAEINRDS
jgi:aminoglycoside/choline kinase family phosphotransferase